MQPNASAAPPHTKGSESVASMPNASFFKAFTGRKDKRPASASTPTGQLDSLATDYPNPPQIFNPPSRSTPSLLQSTNIFSLVERFTFRPSASESHLPNPPPVLPDEIQYWAGVVMRNACRKDDSRGGIRQCANVQCGKWEKFPREFAKCRRCRKAKYCGKECQSRAWSEGHRFWCCVKEEEPDGINTSVIGIPVLSVGTGQRERERERERDETRNIIDPAATTNLTLLGQMRRGGLGGTVLDMLPSHTAESGANVENQALNTPTQSRPSGADVAMQSERAYPVITTSPPSTSSRVTSQSEASTSSQNRWSDSTSLQLQQSDPIASNAQAGNATAEAIDTMSVFHAPYLNLRARTGDFNTLTGDDTSITEIVGRSLSTTDLPSIVRGFAVSGPDSRTVTELLDEVIE